MRRWVLFLVLPFCLWGEERQNSPYWHPEDLKHPVKRVCGEDEEFDYVPWSAYDPCVETDEGYWYPGTDYYETGCLENKAYEQLNPYCLRWVWFPEAPPLFLPLKADPRQLTASVGWRFNDTVVGKHVIDVSYFDIIPLLRWFNIFVPTGQLEVDLEGALWAVFQPTLETSPLVNADYYIGASVNYALWNWSFRLRGYHISSHIGDEFLILHPNFDRRNPSAEYIDFFASYYMSDDLRFYTGVGYVPHSDVSFPCKEWFFQGGAEVYLPWFRFISCGNMVEGKPYFAMNFLFTQDNNWEVDQTYVLGYEFGKLTGLERKFRIYLEYHDGFSEEGQFCHQRTDYFSIRVSYGF